VQQVELTDPRALRAYAHPTRLALVGLLRREGPKTATEAAQAIGESVASCSFHLRQLARYGLIEPVEGDHGRSKPWRATAMFTTWRNDSDDPEVQAAMTALDQVVLERHVAAAARWLARREDEPSQWRRVSGFSDYLLHLTPAELRALGEAIEGLIAEYLPRQEDPQARPSGSRAVTLIQLTFPRDPQP
jgi:predicted ArsR family transcriptional regulator